jgi:hypothetical protein
MHRKSIDWFKIVVTAILFVIMTLALISGALSEITEPKQGVVISKYKSESGYVVVYADEYGRTGDKFYMYAWNWEKVLVGDYVDYHLWKREQHGSN